MKRKNSVLAVVVAFTLFCSFCLIACNKNETKDSTLTINRGVLAMNVGETFQLVAESSKGDLLEWSSDKIDVATISQTGMVVAIADGNALITVKAGNLSKTCSVTVTTVIQDEVKFNHSTLKIVKGSNVDLTATVYNGETVVSKAVSWSFEVVGNDGNPDAIATHLIKEKVCTLTGVLKGKIKIIATVGNSSATCVLEVIEDYEVNPDELIISIVLQNGTIKFNGFSICEYNLFIDGVKINDAIFTIVDGTYSCDMTKIVKLSGTYEIKVGYVHNKSQYYSNSVSYDTGIIGVNELNTFDCEIPGAYWSNIEEVSYSTAFTHGENSKKSLKLTRKGEADATYKQINFRNKSGKSWNNVTEVNFWLYVDSASFKKADISTTPTQLPWPTKNPGSVNEAFMALAYQDSKITNTEQPYALDTWMKMSIANPIIITDEGVECIVLWSANHKWYINEGVPVDENGTKWQYSYYIDDMFVEIGFEAKLENKTITFDKSSAGEGDIFSIIDNKGNILQENVDTGMDVSSLFALSGNYNFKVVLKNSSGTIKMSSAVLTYVTGIINPNEINSFDCEGENAYWSNAEMVEYSSIYTRNAESKKSLKITRKGDFADANLLLHNIGSSPWTGKSKISFWIYVDSKSFVYHGTDVDTHVAAPWPAKAPGVSSANDALMALITHNGASVVVTGDVKADSWFKVTLTTLTITQDAGLETLAFVSSNQGWFVNDGNIATGAVTHWEYAFYIDDMYFE